MYRFFQFFLCLICFLVLSWATTSAAWAHDGPPAIVLDWYQFAPGEVVEIRGINLVSDLPVQVVLTTNGREYLLGAALCDGHGDFIQVFTLPGDAETAVYEVRAIDTNIPGLAPILATTTIKIDPAPAPDTLLTENAAPQPTSQMQSLATLLRGLLVVTCLTLFVVLWWQWRRPSTLSPHTPKQND